MKKSAFLQHLLSLLIFGFNGIVASAIALGSMQIVFFRTLLGSLLLLLLFALSRRKWTFHRRLRDSLFLLASGIAMGISWMFLYEAYARVGVGVGTLLNYCGPVIIMVLSPLLFGEKMTAAKILGFLAVLGGVVLINSNALGGTDGDMGGIVCGLLSAVTYAVMILCNKKSGIKGMENVTLQLLTAFLTLTVILALTRSFPAHIETADILPILLLGLLHTGVGCYLYFSTIGALPVQTVAVCGYLEPLGAVLFSALLLHEQMTLWQWLGTTLILGGAMLGELVRPKMS